MKITDEAVQAAINAWFEETREHVKSVEPLPEQARRMRLALEASLPHLQTDDVAAVTKPVANIEYRTPKEVFDIMCDRIRALSAEPTLGVEA